MTLPDVPKIPQIGVKLLYIIPLGTTLRNKNEKDLLYKLLLKVKGVTKSRQMLPRILFAYVDRVRVIPKLARQIFTGRSNLATTKSLQSVISKVFKKINERQPIPLHSN